MCFNDFVQKKNWKEKYGSALIIEWQQCFYISMARQWYSKNSFLEKNNKRTDKVHLSDLVA